MKVVDFKLVFRLMGLLLLIESGFILICAIVSLGYHEEFYKYLLYTTGITAGVGLLGIICTPGVKHTLGKREGYIIVTSTWVLFSLFGAIPAYWGGITETFTDAFFESISGFSGTGSTILNDIDGCPNGYLLWRSFTQWIGGLGIIMFSLALLPLISEGSMSLFAAETTGPTKEKTHAKLSRSSKMLWALYIGLTLLAAFSFWLAEMTPFDAINHAMTALATGGFSTHGASIAYWNSPAIEYIAILFMFIGGTNFGFMLLMLQGQFRKFKQQEEFKLYVSMVVFFAFFIALNLYFTDTYETVESSIRNALFYVVSCITTTGFTNADYMTWHPFAWSMIMIIMLFGASSGSTSGGIKLVRTALLGKSCYNQFERLLHPNAVVPVKFNGHVIRDEVMKNVLAFICLYSFLIVAGALVLSTTGLPLDEALGSAISAIGNNGPSFGSIGTGSNFVGLATTAKWTMAFLMLVGRLEIFTVLIIFTPAFWRK